MVDPIDVCKICLRTDVKLKEVDKVLSNYHYAVTDFALFHVDTRLCPQCKYLLRKSYNFSEKCIKAAKILQLWHQNVIYGKANRNPLSTLHTKIPQLPLKVYPQDITAVYTYEEPDPNLANEAYIAEGIGSYVKKEIEVDLPKVGLKTLVSVKIEECNAFQEVLIQSDRLNDNEKDDDILSVDDTDNFGRLDDLAISDDASQSSDDECLAAKRLRRYQESSQNSTEKVKRSSPKKKRDKEAISDEKCNSDYKRQKADKGIINRLQNMNNDLNIIYKNWEKTSLTDLPIVSLGKEDIASRRCVAKKKVGVKEDVTGQNVKRKDVVAKLASLSGDLDSIRENCGKLINYKEGFINPKERLRAELISKFASCGELKTEDGYVIDTNTIMGCFDRVSECLMRRLWRFVHGKPTLEQRAINTLKHIQNKYQNEHQYESVFTIEYLNTKEKIAEEFERRRTYECYLNAKYKCETCFLGFKYEAQAENHANSHETSAGDFLCPTCGVRHKTKKTLDTHSKSHEAVYKCKLCPLVTYYRYSMMNHYHQHEGMVYKCELCDTTFRSKSAYKTHCGLRHSPGANTCTVCGRALASARALAWHLARHERDAVPGAGAGSPAPCAPCGLTFASQQAYLRHARTAHTSAAYSMQKSKDGAPKKKPVHTCRVCDAAGSSIGWLTLHFRLEHPAVDMALLYADKQLHLCEICGKGYANVYNLRDHLAIHADVRAHACSVCGARFHRAVSLAQHGLTHQPPRRACPACGKRFHSQSNLNNHMRGHTGDRKYKCTLCDKGFLHRNALNEHVRGVHYKLRRVRKRADNEKLAASNVHSTC